LQLVRTEIDAQGGKGTNLRRRHPCSVQTPS
jgi:hypothetical protein